MRVADIGSGTLRNLHVQETSFDEVSLVETERRCKKLKLDVADKNHIQLQSTREFQLDRSRYDAIFLISVLHTIPDPKYRQRLVNLAASKVRRGGFIVVDVPQSETYYLRRSNSLPRFKDGYLLRWGRYYTFYKNFYASELDALFEKTSKLQLFEKTHYCKHLIRIWRRYEKRD